MTIRQFETKANVAKFGHVILVPFFLFFIALTANWVELGDSPNFLVRNILVPVLGLLNTFAFLVWLKGCYQSLHDEALKAKYPYGFALASVLIPWVVYFLILIVMPYGMGLELSQTSPIVIGGFIAVFAVSALMTSLAMDSVFEEALGPAKGKGIKCPSNLTYLWQFLWFLGASGEILSGHLENRLEPGAWATLDASVWVVYILWVIMSLVIIRYSTLNLVHLLRTPGQGHNPEGQA